MTKRKAKGAAAPGPFDRLYATKAARRSTERDRALVEATENLARAIQARGLTHADFGRLVGWPSSTVARLLGGEHSCSLRSLSDAYHALGYEIAVGYRLPTRDPQIQEVPRKPKPAKKSSRS